MSQIQAVAMDNCEVKLTGAINLVCEFFYDRPKSHFGTGRNSGKLKESSPKYKTTMPDLSKLVRCVEDALTGIAWKDDNQVVSITARKRWLNYKNNDSHKYQGVWIEINEII